MGKFCCTPQEAELLPGAPVALKEFCKRSRMALLPTVQVVKVLEAEGWQFTPGVKSWLLKRSLRLVSSQLCEGMFNSQKNCKLIKGKKRFMTPHKAMAAVLKKGVADKVHQYHPVPKSCSRSTRDLQIPKEAFLTKASGCSMSFKGIGSTSQKTDWYSPKADRHAVAAADLQVARDVCADEQLCLGMLRTMYLGAAMKVEHCIMVRLKGTAQWFFALAHCPASAAILWPATTGTTPAGEAEYWVPSDCPKEPTIVSVSDWSKWEGFSYTWRSPMWQYLEFPRSRGQKAANAIRAFRACPTYGLQELAARCAFWLLPKAFLDTLAKDMGLQLPSGSTLFDTVWALCEGCLPDASKEELLQIVQGRIASTAKALSSITEELANSEEAMEVLEQRDSKIVSKHLEEAEAHKQELESFTVQYKVKHNKVCPPKAEVKAKGRPKKGQGASSSSAATSHYNPTYPTGTISLADAKAMCPPGAIIWAGKGIGNWQGHFPPFPRVSRQWSKYTEPVALQLVLRNLWGHYLDKNGKGKSDCPIQGLFD